MISHSPLTGIFLIRTENERLAELSHSHLSHSPLTGIFLIRTQSNELGAEGTGVTVP